MLKDLIYLSCSNFSNLINSFDPIFQSIFNKVSENIIYSKIGEISNEKLLDTLALQFNAKGYHLAITIQEKRDFVKKSILLNRYKGTPYSIKESIKSLGYYDCEVFKNNQPILYNGEYYYNNTFTYSDTTRWALFNVIIDIGENKELTSETIENLIDLINQYKNQRSHLENLSFKATLKDQFDELIDVLASILEINLDDLLPWGIRYDGSINHNQGRELLFDGNLTYNQEQNYFNIISEGTNYDNNQDLQNFNIDLFISDNVKIDSFFNGEFKYNNIIDYGNEKNSALDLLNSNILTKNNDKYEFDIDDSLKNILSLSSQSYHSWGIRYDGSINHNQGRELLFDGNLTYNQEQNYFNIISEGTNYNNNQDLQNFDANIALSDNVKITPNYDGLFLYNSFNYGENDFPVIDTKMNITLTKHFKYNGKYNYLGLSEFDIELFDGNDYYNGQNFYKEAINYIGSIKNMEYV